VARFGVVPVEVPVQRTSAGCAPLFIAKVQAMLADLNDGREMPFEWLRTPERQRYLYGHGRDYDDGRGIVTNAQSSLFSWHGFGLACDVVEKDATPWAAPPTFWNRMGEAAERQGLVWGGRWKRADLPHVQWDTGSASPTADDRALAEAEGIEAVWRLYGATTNGI